MFQTRSRRFRLLMLTALLPLFPVVGCSSSNTDRGIVNGGVLGAIGGLLVAGPRGALVGTAIGATAGGLAGAAADHSEQKAVARVAAQRSLQLQDIVSMTQSGSSDEVIIAQIRNTGSIYGLRNDEVVWLQNNGVRPPVIQYMQATSGGPVIYAQPQPVYIVQPAPPPVVGVGIGFR